MQIILRKTNDRRKYFTSAFFICFNSKVTVSSKDLPIILPNFSYIVPMQVIAALKLKINLKKTNFYLINNVQFGGQKAR